VCAGRAGISRSEVELRGRSGGPSAGVHMPLKPSLHMLRNKESGAPADAARVGARGRGSQAPVAGVRSPTIRLAERAASSPPAAAPASNP
jgi:hypothetical protein